MQHYSPEGHFTPISAGFVGFPPNGFRNPSVMEWWRSEFSVGGKPFKFSDDNFICTSEEVHAIHHVWNMFSYKPEMFMFARVDEDSMLPLHIDSTARSDSEVKVRLSSVCFPLEPFNDQWGDAITENTRVGLVDCYGVNHQKMHGVDNVGKPTRYSLQASFYDPLDEIFSRYCQGRLFYK